MNTVSFCLRFAERMAPPTKPKPMSHIAHVAVRAPHAVASEIVSDPFPRNGLTSVKWPRAKEGDSTVGEIKPALKLRKAKVRGYKLKLAKMPFPNLRLRPCPAGRRTSSDVIEPEWPSQ